MYIGDITSIQSIVHNQIVESENIPLLSNSIPITKVSYPIKISV